MNIFNVNVPKDSLSMIFDEFNGVENYNTTLYLHKSKIVYDEELIENILGKKIEKEYKDEIWKEIKKINENLPVFKHIKKIEITTQEFAKTTTQKVKRYKELEKVGK